MSPPLLSRFVISAGSDAQCKKEGLGLSAVDSSACLEILGGTTAMCPENRYLLMCFSISGCVASAFSIIPAETVRFLFVGSKLKRHVAVPHSVPRRIVTVVAEPHGKLLVRPRFVGIFLLPDPISHLYCDLGRSSQRSAVTLTGICTQCQLVREVAGAGN